MGDTDFMDLKTSRRITITAIVSFLLTGGSLVWYQSSFQTAMKSEIKSIVEQVTDIKINGTVGFRKHEALDDERVSSLKIQVADLKDAIKTLGIIQVQVSTMNEHLRSVEAKLDDLKVSLDNHEKRTAGGK